MPHNFDTSDQFRFFNLPMEGNLFHELHDSVRFEEIGKGRQGALLVKLDEAGRVPLLRTTTRYSKPAQSIRPIHERLCQDIQQSIGISLKPTHAMIEIYTNAYTTMGPHSDQALDLADDSSIVIFSCYEHPDRVSSLRKLLIESKASGEQSEIVLSHNSVVMFSLDVNRRYRHKIVLDATRHTPENRWLGVMYWTSKTFVQFRDEGVFFADGTMLTLANDEQRQEFFRLRKRENSETDFVYPPITYTISESDLMFPECQE